MSRRHRSREKSSTKPKAGKKVKPASQPRSPGPAAAIASWPHWARFRSDVLPLILLILAGSLAYMNAWPNNLVWDDGVFGQGDRLSGVSLADIRSYFLDDAWAAIGSSTGIYRPLLFVSVALDIQLFGEWVAGFHLVNIFLHLLVTLLVYGFINYLLQVFGSPLPLARNCALLAALVFAIHPIHTEAVNSIFNRSEMLVSLGIVGGLWWFLKTVDDHPWRAWVGLGLVYLLVMLCRETGIVLPAIVVVFLWFVTTGNWKQRLIKCLPVLWPLIPLAIYIGLRAYQLDTPMSAEEMPRNLRTSGATGVPVLGLFFDVSRLLPAVAIWFDSFKLMIWPDPLLTFHPPTETNEWLALISQLALLAFAVFKVTQKRPGLFLGLAFFYLTILPSSRVVGELTVFPHLAERYLYTPSVGMAIVLAFALSWLAQRFTFKAALIPVLAMIMFMTPLTYARNAQWSSTLRLAEADYRNNPGSSKLLQTLVSALLMKGDLIRAESFCNEHINSPRMHWYLASNCGQVYTRLRKYDLAEVAFLLATRKGVGRAGAHYGLAAMYLSQDRREDALEHFDLAVSTEMQAFMREYLAAEKLVRMYPSDRDRLLEAKAHMEKSIELQPQYYHGRKRLADINEMLSSSDVREAE